jgi:glutathione S-transferase
MKLYDFPFSPNCRKVRAVAYELGIPLEVELVDLIRGAQRAPAFLAKNPNGKVPVLEDGDLVLWESTAIIRYLAEGSPLVPTSRRAAIEVTRWLSWQLAHLAPAMSKVAFERIVKRLTGRGEPDPVRVEEGITELTALTATFDAHLAATDYVAGPLSLADFALAAHYSMAGAIGLDLAPYRHVAGWLTRISARDSMKRALAEAQVMQ